MNEELQLEDVLPDEEPDTEVLETESEEVLDVLNAPASTETVIEYVEVPADPEVSYNVSVVFVLSMIFGAIAFSILSRRWYV